MVIKCRGAEDRMLFNIAVIVVCMEESNQRKRRHVTEVVCKVLTFLTIFFPSVTFAIGSIEAQHILG